MLRARVYVVLTVAAVLLGLAALDDITTGSEPSYTLEWLALTLCGGWLLFMAAWLLRGLRRQT